MGTAQAAEIDRPVSDPLRRAVLAMIDGGASFYALATASGVEIGTLARFARGECGLRLESVEKLFAALGLGMARESGDNPQGPAAAIRSAIAAGPLGVSALGRASGVAHTTIAKFLDGRAGLETVSADKLAAALGLRAVQGPRPEPAPPERAGDAGRPILDAILAEIAARGLDAGELARATGIRKAHLDKLLEGRGDVKLATADRLCEYFGLGFAGARDGMPAVPSAALLAAIEASGLGARKLGKLSGVVYQAIDGFRAGRVGIELASADRIAAALGLVVVRGQVARPPDPPPPVDPAIPYLDGLRAAAKATKLSVYALSRLSGLAVPSVSRFMKGENNLVTASVAKLARAVGFDPRPADPPPVGPARPRSSPGKIRPEPIPWRGTRSQLDREIQAIASEATRDVVRTLVRLMPARPTKLKLERESRHGDAVNLLKDFADSGAPLARAAGFPGQGRVGYWVEIELIRED